MFRICVSLFQCPESISMILVFVRGQWPMASAAYFQGRGKWTSRDSGPARNNICPLKTNMSPENWWLERSHFLILQNDPFSWDIFMFFGAVTSQNSCLTTVGSVFPRGVTLEKLIEISKRFSGNGSAPCPNVPKIPIFSLVPWWAQKPVT